MMGRIENKERGTELPLSLSALDTRPALSIGKRLAEPEQGVRTGERGGRREESDLGWGGKEVFGPALEGGVPGRG